MEAMLLKPEEAAALIGISRSTLYTLISRGELKALHVGRSRRIAKAELLRWVSEVSRSGDATMPTAQQAQ